MPRRPRLHIANSCYHVSLHGNHGQAVFVNAADRRTLEEFVAEAMHHTRTRVHGYCWAEESIHLLVQVTDVPLGQFMQRIGTRYARHVQRRAGTRGHLFENRYNSRLIDIESYFLELLRDLHLLPVRAGIVTHPAHSPWTSHRAYLSADTHPWLQTDLALRLLHWQPDRARTMYETFILAALDQPSDPALYSGHRHDPRVLGDDRFLANLRWAPDVTDTTPRPNAPPLHEIVQKICVDLGVTEDALRSVRQDRILSRARGLITAVARDAASASLSEIAEYLNRSPSALSRAARRYAK